ncbi:tetratricopeptide repeat protein [Methylobrevis pamukkalensis]|uniref:Tetratricopeptide repeat protein n=1 Tax=Methylobrevis pamukkalensis TaxID=1439726 RepID=A0A1E3GYJ5_9HYPH|nr:tetratricopeptide repeat protein [Methylobrevis pamukkalensis]ODN69138.1 Tetratricopeptide repeat protein [Methylobrevis pamukkalensis]
MRFHVQTSLRGLVLATALLAAPAAVSAQTPAPTPDLPLLDEPGGENPFDPNVKPDAPAVVDRNANSLDELFGRLAAAKSPAEAHPFEQRILKRLIDSDSDTVDLMVKWAVEAMNAERWGAALDLLDQALLLQPDFAEGYNRRATVWFMLDDYGRSLADIERALAIEPRHFGALSGLAGIMQRIGETDRAYEVYSRLAAIHPNLPDVRKAIEKLEPDARGRPI